MGISGSGAKGKPGTTTGAATIAVPAFEEAWRLRRSDPGRALALADALREDALASGGDAALGRALLLAGSCHMALGDNPAALSALQEALWLLRDGPDRDRARALSEAGDLDRRLGRHADALDQLFEALKLYERLEDGQGQADTLTRLGVVFFHHDALDEAEHAYLRSLAIREELGDRTGVAGLRNNLAKVCTSRGAHAEALAHLTEACRGFEAADEPRGLAMALLNTAVALEDLGDRRGAEMYLRVAVTLYEAASESHGACEARTRLGHLLGRQGDVDGALSWLRRAHADAEATGLDDECARAAEALADVLEARGDAAEALGWLRHLREVEGRLFSEASETRLRSLQVRYQIERLDLDSVTDALTGLLNRRGLDRALSDRVAHARADGSDLAVLMLDLDNFKRINDTFSHGTGDEVLRVVARLLRDATRPTDVRARYGGEEIVVLLPGSDLACGRKVADKLRARIRDHDWGIVADRLSVTTSIGVTALSAVSRPEELLAAADRALYEAKRGGRDRVCVA